jgi:hypothetical protein
VIGSIIRGSSRGIFNDTPVDLLAVIDCPAGRHGLELTVAWIKGSWGIPFVDTVGNPPSADLVVNRGFVVREIWD